MTIKTVIVHVEPSDACEDRLRAAARLARRFDACVVGLGAIAEEPILTSPYVAANVDLSEALRVRIRADLASARARFESSDAGRAPGSRWVQSIDFPARALALHARGADLIVASRSGRHSDPAYRPDAADLIMNAGAPVFMSRVEPGADPVPPRAALLAWKDGREARRALADALPFLQTAERAYLLRVTGPRGGEPEAGWADEMLARLARHGVKAEPVVEQAGEGGVARTIEHAAAARDVDLISIGAYGHSRLSEWALGGVTQDLLEASRFDILFSR